MIRLLRLGGCSTHAISSVLRDDLCLKETSDGSFVEMIGDREILNYAYEGDLQEAIHTKHGKNPSIFGYRENPNWKGGGKKDG